MRVAGLQKCSFVDYPGKLAAVLFTPGCNMDCSYCHNRPLLGGADTPGEIDVKDVLAFLARRRGMLDAVVITGGEPTLQRGLGDLCHSIRDLGYSIKLDTNGTNPGMVRDLMRDGLVDYLAMDLKAPLPRYEEICRRGVDRKAIASAADLLMGSGLAYEFRTTFAPPLERADIIEIARWVSGADRYVLQQYRRPEPAERGSLLLRHAEPHSDEYVLGTARQVEPIVGVCEVRGVAEAARGRTAGAAG